MADLERLPGNRVLRAGPVAIGAIHPDARELLDRIMAEWEPHVESVRRNNPPGTEITPYMAFYWLVRWSGLIDPTVQMALLERREG